jgi:hypothetical protein
VSESYSGLFEGQPYIIGREGHIYISDVQVSRRHAVIRLYKAGLLCETWDLETARTYLKMESMCLSKEVLLRKMTG